MPSEPPFREEDGPDENDLPVSRPAWPVTGLSTAAQGGVLWVFVAGVLAWRPGPRRRAAGHGLVAGAAGTAARRPLKAPGPAQRPPRPPAPAPPAPPPPPQ